MSRALLRRRRSRDAPGEIHLTEGEAAAAVTMLDLAFEFKSGNVGMASWTSSESSPSVESFKAARNSLRGALEPLGKRCWVAGYKSTRIR